jgi:hypothetical protein
MSNEYKSNHYVPVWYQKRFIPLNQRDKDLLYLDLRPETFKGPGGNVLLRRAMRRLGPRYCFCENDLYTTNLGAKESREIEQYFFGQIDSKGREAVNHFANFKYTMENSGSALNDIMMYMSTQKLRTPKGLSWLKEQAHATDKNLLLRRMVELRKVFCAVWTESVWQISDASRSKTKFLISDHPVTVYNRMCGPKSPRCRRYNDPDIALNGTHTFFPLSPDKILILTNLSWVRNPYQSAIKVRPNSNPFRDALFIVPSVQSERFLSEQEVREINFITKSRALRYVAASEEDWLYPERYVKKSDWARFGHGYLFMPDPRAVTFSHEMVIVYKDGSSTAFDEYGRRPWQRDFRKNPGPDEWQTFHRFQGEYARLFGPYRRGKTFEDGYLSEERDSDELYKYHLSLEKRKYLNRKSSEED